MNPILLKKAKQVFDGAPVQIIFQCSVYGGPCLKCTEECQQRVTAVISKASSKIVGWFENDNIVKTNARPSKKYLKKFLGITKEKKRAGRRSFTKTNKEDVDRDGDRIKRNQRRTEKDKRERGTENTV